MCYNLHKISTIKNKVRLSNSAPTANKILPWSNPFFTGCGSHGCREEMSSISLELLLALIQWYTVISIQKNSLTAVPCNKQVDYSFLNLKKRHHQIQLWILNVFAQLLPFPLGVSGRWGKFLYLCKQLTYNTFPSFSYTNVWHDGL